MNNWSNYVIFVMFNLVTGGRDLSKKIINLSEIIAGFSWSIIQEYRIL
jgi:hypothetical protein